MPSEYRVPITRDVTETAMVGVIADNVEHAVQLAEQLARVVPEVLKWEPDDCMGGEPYFAGGTDYESVETDA